MPVTIQLEEVKKNSGRIGDGPGGTVTFTFVTRSPELLRHQVIVTVPDYSDQNRSLEAARRALLSFADGLRKAAQQPLG